MDQNREREIIGRVLSGERQDYALLIDAYKGPVFNLAFRMTGSREDAEDLTQEIFIRAYQKLHMFNQEKKYFTWLYTIGINLIRNYLKKKSSGSSGRQLSDAGQPDDHHDGEGDAEASVRQLEEAMRRLSAKAREAIILKYHQGLTFEDIAEITGKSVSAVKMRIYRGLESMKKIMCEKNIL